MADNSTLSEISKASLSANTTLSQNLGKASNTFSNIGNTASEDIDSLLKTAFNVLRNTGFDGVAGLETGQVETMKAAITSYVDNINSALEPLNLADARNVFGDAIAPKIEEFVRSVKGACQAVVSNMGAFKDDLTAIQTAMQTKAQTVNTSVGNTSGELTSSKSSWTYNGSGGSN